MSTSCEWCEGSGRTVRGDGFQRCNHDGTATFTTDPKKELAVSLLEAHGETPGKYDRLELDALAASLELE